MWEHLNALMQYLGMVPAEWFNNLSETQKLTMLPNAVAIVLALVCLYLLALLWRERKVPNIEKVDTELDLKIGENCHDFLVNMLKENSITEKQYRRYCRILKRALPGAMYGGTYSEKVRKLIKVGNLKRKLAWNLNNKIHLPTIGWRIFDKAASKTTSKFR